MFNSWSQKASGRLDQLLSGESISNSLPNVCLAASALKSPPVPPVRPQASKDATVAYLSTIERQALHLQRQIQGLLDDQADLLAPRLGQQQDDKSQRMTASGVMPVRQPRKSRPSLYRTRDGISKMMTELSDLRLEEQEVLEVALRERNNRTQQAQRYTERRIKLRQEIDAIQDDPQSKRVNALRGEGEAVQEQINNMELQLEELRSKQRAVNSELSRLENSVQAKLSSYTGSLKLLESEIQQAVAEAPITPLPSAGSSSMFLALPEIRRTLEMMVELVNEETDQLRSRQSSARAEQEALEAGAAMWQEVVDVVSSFETQLRREITQLSPPGKLIADDEDSESAHARSTASMDDLIHHLVRVVGLLEAKLKEAEVNGWNLLVCAVGAELEALREGHKILESLKPRRPISRASSPAWQVNEEPDGRVSSQQLAVSGVRRRRMASDDEPDPDLLLSTQDQDTDYESSI